jgi:hypothetical protein
MTPDIELRILILLALQRALLGEVSPSLRGVACSWNSKIINLYAYFDGEVSDDDQDSMETVETEVASSCTEHQMNLECIPTDSLSPISIDSSAEWVYLRKEFS